MIILIQGLVGAYLSGALVALAAGVYIEWGSFRREPLHYLYVLTFTICWPLNARLALATLLKTFKRRRLLAETNRHLRDVFKRERERERLAEERGEQMRLARIAELRGARERPEVGLLRLVDNPYGCMGRGGGND